MHVALIATLAAAALGSTEISVTAARTGAANAPWQRSLARLDRPTARTEETLRRYELDRDYRRDPARALLRLERRAREQPEPEIVFALAELSWLEARRNERRRKADALNYDLDAVTYAFDFLFDPDLAAGRQPSDPRFLMAIDLYNGGLDRIIRAMKAKGPILPGGKEIVLESRERQIRLQVSLEKSPWTAEDIDELLLCWDFQVTGLPLSTYQYGLGVPLIGVRRAEARSVPPGDAEEPAVAARMHEKYFPPEMAFPMTAFLRPNSRLRDPAADVAQTRDCTLDLLDPVQIRSVHLGNYALAIEADLTTPLAYMWSRTDYGSYKWAGFLRPGDALERTGLMLLRPYEPGKIPVVMVHGLMSSPLCWIPMVNELLRNPEIQRDYQFFLYVYPTGVPVPIAASYLRDALKQARRDFDPSGADPGFNRMVLLGHSMGGLLSHAMAVDSKNHFWNLNSFWQFKDLIGPRDVLDKLAHYTFFEALPFVERVVFLATPHRGSEYANGFVGRLGSGLISQPDAYSNLLSQLVKDNPEAFNTRRFRRLPTSIETLEVDAPVLMALLAMPPRPGVTFHSILGARAPGAPTETTDGVVTYRSSHFEKAESELLVASDHGVPKSSAAIQEVLRILRLHRSQGPRPPALATSPPPRESFQIANRPGAAPAAIGSPGPNSPAEVGQPSSTALAPGASPLDNLPPLIAPAPAP